MLKLTFSHVTLCLGFLTGLIGLYFFGKGYYSVPPDYGGALALMMFGLIVMLTSAFVRPLPVMNIHFPQKFRKFKKS